MKKRITYLATTDRPDSMNRKYSDYVFENCKTALENNLGVNELYDLVEFKRHDMINANNLDSSLFNLLTDVDYYIILIDNYNSTYNPNVWFELGVLAITTNKPMILISQENNNNQPFYIRNRANVLLFPKVEMNEDASGYFVDEDKTNRTELRNFKKLLVDRVLYSKDSPFEALSDSFHLKNSGYKNLRDLEAKLSEIISQTEIAEYIDGEENAFHALTEAVNSARFSLRTSRFANESIVKHITDDDYDVKIAKKQNEFMEAIFNASIRIKDNYENDRYTGVTYRCDRIICNNSPLKWNDVYVALTKSSDIMRVYIRKCDYSINFELVIIDDRIAFIHFYQPAYYDETEDTKNNPVIQKIKSTLKISDTTICTELAKIFDRLHHRDFEGDCKDLSRTLLGVEREKYEIENPKNVGFFSTKDRPQNTKMRAYIRDIFLNALLNWDFPNKSDDKINMLAGFISVFGTAIGYDLSHHIKEVALTEDQKTKLNRILGEIE